MAKFNEEMLRLEGELRRKKGMKPINRKVFDTGTTDGAGRGGDTNATYAKAMSRLHVQVADLRAELINTKHELQAETKTLIGRLPQVQMNKTLTITQLGKTVGKIKGLRHRQVEILMKAISIRGRDGDRKNLWLTGNMGGGKSTALKQCAAALGIEYRYTGQAEMKSDVVGSIHPISKEYMMSEFVKTFIHGGLWAGEEIDSWAPRATTVLHVPLANGYITTPDGETHQRHPDCVIVVCANTWGHGATAEYVGRNKLDGAFLDRFSPRMEWEYDSDLEYAAAGDDYVVDAVQQARMNADTYGIKVAISPRSSINIADMVRNGFDIRTSMEMDFLAGLDTPTKKRLLEGVDL